MQSDRHADKCLSLILTLILTLSADLLTSKSLYAYGLPWTISVPTSVLIAEVVPLRARTARHK